MTGTFKDWRNNNEVSVYRSSNAEASTVWLNIKGLREGGSEATAQLSIQDRKLLIAILEKSIADEEE